jgi:dTDP-4-amino-4,6-dideoxygalactose transaminase
LHIAVAGAGIGPGDEVITPAFTFIATALSVLHHNAIPVFVDIEPDGFNIDPKKIEAAITPRTRAIMPVHIHGTPCDLDAIFAIAKKHNLLVIEDACQAHGAEYRGKKVGPLGVAGAFSLQSSKNLACGEGGLFVTNDDEVFQRANRARMFGEDVKPGDAAGYRIDRALDSDRAYDSMTMGWMYRSNEMCAALTRTQLRKLDASLASARRNAAILTERLSKLPGVTPQAVPQGCTSSVHKFRLRIDASKVGIEAPPKTVRDAVVRALRAEGVDAVLWQTQPVAGQGLLREKVGYGKGWPWSQSAPVNYDLAQYSETQRLLDSSVVLFSHTYPIAPQPASLCEAYAEAFAKVWGRLGEVLEESRGRY